MEQSNHCYCDDPDHEMCWDGLAVLFDKYCPCCQSTLNEMYDGGDIEIEEMTEEQKYHIKRRQEYYMKENSDATK